MYLRSSTGNRDDYVSKWIGYGIGDQHSISGGGRDLYALSQKCDRRLLASSCLSVCPSAWNNSASTGRIFMKFLYMTIFRKSVEKIQVPLKSDKNKGYFKWRPMYIFLSYLAHFFSEWEMFQTKVVDKIKICVLCSVTFFLKSCLLGDNVEKYL